jgi:aspartate racemase
MFRDIVTLTAAERLTTGRLSSLGSNGVMKTVGIIGGIGPETTVIYYRLLIAAGHTRIVINSVEAGTLVPLVLGQDFPAVADYMCTEIRRLAAAGAEVALIAANTPHVCFEQIQRRSPIPLVSIVEATASHAASQGLRRLALFGTRVTMEGSFYPEVFARHGLTIVTPTPDERTYIHDKYMNELFRNVVLPETRSGLLSIVDAMAAREAVDGVVLGGTELSLILPDASHGGVPLIDTTRVHVDAVLKALAPSP